MKKMDVRGKYIVYSAVGVLLGIATMITETKGLQTIDKEIYKTAIELDERVNGFGFDDFRVGDYNVRFFDGDVDYVVKGDKIEEQEPVYQTFVGTTVEVDGEYQVLLPAYQKFSNMFAAMSTAESMAEGETAFAEEEYSTNAHVTTLWHEAFHTWQFTNQETQIEQMLNDAGIEEENTFEDMMKNEVDSNQFLVLLFEQEMQLLQKVWEEEDIQVKRQLLGEALEVQEKRESQLSGQAIVMERYYETIEGSACYVESCVYQELEGKHNWEEHYMQPFEYSNGLGKYYSRGMLKCMILDQIMPDWKGNFDVTEGFYELLKQGMEEMQV